MLKISIIKLTAEMLPEHFWSAHFVAFNPAFHWQNKVRHLDIIVGSTRLA